MLNFYAVGTDGLQQLPAGMSPTSFKKAVWIDVHEPSEEEEAFLEQHLHIDVPTREEMRDLEESSRLYEESGALFMTAMIVSGVSQHRPRKSEITFVLTPRHLVTIRYADPLAIKTFGQKCARQPEAHKAADQVFVSLLEQIIQRIAEVLEKTTTDLDNLASAIFEDDLPAVQADKPVQTKKEETNATANLQNLVRRLGRNSALLGKLRESLLSFSRMIAFLRENGEGMLQNGARAKLKTLDRDVRSLNEYEQNLAAQIGYLQDATFNLINIDQNRVIKVFSIAAVLFLPPTLVATMYGMNFQYMPELKWAYGYPLSLVLMVLSAVVPFVWFKRKGWF